MSSHSTAPNSNSLPRLSLPGVVVPMPIAGRWLTHGQEIARRKTVRILFVLALVIFGQTSRGQMCIPIEASQIQFSQVLNSKAHGPTQIETGDKWVLSDDSVRYLPNPTDANQPANKDRGPWAFVGQPQNPGAVLVIGDTLWVGTTKGVFRYSVKEPGVALKLVTHEAPDGRQDKIDQISIAFDIVLLSGLHDVYRYVATKSTQSADHTDLPVGRAYGSGPYWWVTKSDGVTKSDVYLLSQDLTLSPSILQQNIIDTPIVAGGYLWFTNANKTLFAVSENGTPHVIEQVSGSVTAIGVLQSNDDPKLTPDVWIGTDQGLWRVPLNHSAAAGVTLAAAREESGGGGEIQKFLVLQDRLFYGVCSKQGDHCATSVRSSPLEEFRRVRYKCPLIFSGHLWRVF